MALEAWLEEPIVLGHIIYDIQNMIILLESTKFFTYSGIVSHIDFTIASFIGAEWGNREKVKVKKYNTNTKKTRKLCRSK